MMGSAKSAMRSPFYRREMWNYAKWVVRKWKMIPATVKFLKGLVRMRKYMAIEPLWANGTDPEIILHSHRFEWAGKAKKVESEAECLDFLAEATRWIDDNPFRPGAPGWDAYSASRRASNWVLLLSVLRAFGPEYPPVKKVNGSIERHASFILSGMEYRGEATNNHFLTNAAALYMIGVHSGSVSMISAAREIVRYATGRLFTSEGFLCEGSSHYHMLVGQRMAEIMSAAIDANDQVLCADLSLGLAGIFMCANVLTEHELMPLFGDISPDVDPEDSMAHLARFNMPDDSLKDMDFIALPESGLYRLRKGPWSVFMYANPKGHVPPGSHGHDDIGGFVLYHDGKPVLVDSGRCSYERNPMSDYGRSAMAHNTIMMDGLGLSIVHSHNCHLPLVLESYPGNSTPMVSVVADDESFRGISVSCGGFGRIRGGGIFLRVISIDDGAVTIEDTVEGFGRHQLEWFFHFHPSVSRGLGGFDISAEGEDVEREDAFGREGAEPLGWYSDRYGQVAPTATVVFREMAILPATRRFVLRKNG